MNRILWYSQGQKGDIQQEKQPFLTSPTFATTTKMKINSQGERRKKSGWQTYFNTFFFRLEAYIQCSAVDRGLFSPKKKAIYTFQVYVFGNGLVSPRLSLSLYFIFLFVYMPVYVRMHIRMMFCCGYGFKSCACSFFSREAYGLFHGFRIFLPFSWRKEGWMSEWVGDSSLSIEVRVRKKFKRKKFDSETTLAQGHSTGFMSELTETTTNRIRPGNGKQSILQGGGSLYMNVMSYM